MIPIKLILSSDGQRHFYKGFLKEDFQGKKIQYLDENMDTVDIFVSQSKVEIRRDNSLMVFDTDNSHDFAYCTEFGSIFFKLVTGFMHIEENYFKIEYKLYDEQDVLAHKNIILLEYIKE